MTEYKCGSFYFRSPRPPALPPPVYLKLGILPYGSIDSVQNLRVISLFVSENIDA